MIIFCYSAGHEGYTAWNLHDADEEVEEDSSDEEAPEPEMFFIADRALSAMYFPALAEGAVAVDVDDAAVVSLRNRLVYSPASTMSLSSNSRWDIGGLHAPSPP